jgi:hypothetical protein
MGQNPEGDVVVQRVEKEEAESLYTMVRFTQ